VNRILRNLLLAGGVLATVSPAQAGLFDFLFGGPPAPRYQASPYPAQSMPMSPEDSARASASRKADDAARRAAAQQRTADQAARDKETVRQLLEVIQTQGAKAAFMLDPTLRAGDVVVTPSGIEVFEGSGGRMHSANQFRPLRSSRLANRADLALLQKVSGLNAPEGPAPVVAEIRPLTISSPKKAQRKPPPAKTADAKPAISRAQAPSEWSLWQP
jgi:hypothetical protein